MTQQFNGRVSGGVAWRDVHHNYGDVFLHSAGPLPESRLQAEFHAHTGIWCPRGAREIFEDLMTHHGFTAHELAMSWRANSLQWSSDSGELKIVTPLIEAVAAWAMILVTLLFFLALSVPSVLAADQGATHYAVIASGATMFLGSSWLAGRFLVWPRRVAMRVRQVLEPAQRCTQRVREAADQTNP